MRRMRAWGMGTAQHARVEQPGQADVVGVAGPPGDLLLALNPGWRPADDSERGSAPAG